MKKALICFGVVFAFCVGALTGAIADDKADAKAEQEMSKGDSASDRPGEKDLYDQMRAAEKSRDKAAAKQLRTRLMALHNANTLKMKKAKQELRAARKELRQDIKAARQDKKGRR